MNQERPMSKISCSCSSELTDGKLEVDRLPTLRICPSCGHEIDCNTDMIGMPAGVKFDPSDQELIHHLQTMVGDGGSRAHPLIDEFIPTIQGEDGICYTHPENLPGVRRDGLSKHFFHRPSKAYTNGTRKRRKIHAQRDVNSSDNNVTEMRWHKTGKTRPILVGGRQKGCKKILVLYTNFGKHRKPEKTNWVMHQYHLGDQEEKDGELVVSKVFYQTQTRQHVATAAAMVATAEQHMMIGEKADEMSEETHDELSGYAAANANTSAIVMMQQRRTNQLDDGQFSVDHSKNRCHEVTSLPSSLLESNETLMVGARGEDTSHKGKQNDNHNIPSQHQVRSSHLHATPAMSFIVSAPSNKASTVVSPAAVLNKRLHPPAIFLGTKKFEEKEQQQKKKVERRSRSLEEMIKVASTQSSETRRVYQYWPPDQNQEQHG